MKSSYVIMKGWKGWYRGDVILGDERLLEQVVFWSEEESKHIVFLRRTDVKGDVGDLKVRVRELVAKVMHMHAQGLLDAMV